MPTSAAPRWGLMLLNLGTPDAPRTPEVRRYLREFLSDPRVVDIPALGRWLLLNLVILPRRPKQSAEAYAQIWTERGSPLLFHTEDLAAKLRDRLGSEASVEVAMRYGRPSIAECLDRFERAKVDELLVVPLFPQYASATTGSALEKLYAEAGRRLAVPSLRILPPFYDRPAFLEAFAEVGRGALEGFEADRVLMSFHGLPERQIRNADPTGARCLAREDCCATLDAENRNCYRAQCHATARGIARRLGLGDGDYEVAFQSRLGRDPWIRPYTDERVRALAAAGVKRLAVFCPAFVADCLETIEEIGLRAAEDFRAAGGEELRLIPSLNAEDTWADALADMVREEAPGRRGA